MEYTEINPEGNFDGWDNDKLQELKNEKLEVTFGTLLFENDLITASEIILGPYARIPFRKRKYHYSATCLTDGLVITRNGNGKITMLRFKEGDIAYWKFRNTTAIFDLQNIGNTTVKAIILEYKSLKNITDKYSINPQE